MEVIRAKIPEHRWLRAAVIGSYWAAFEIVAGSFLHNLKVPLSGTILASVSVYLLVVFVAGWKQKGLVWRAGLIAALLKSISPSAVILGPMTGIMAEALLLELAILFFGTNMLGFLAGGALAVFSTILHKAVTLLLLYGFNLVKMLEALYAFSAKQLGFEHIGPDKLLILIAVIYLTSGVIMATAGYLTAKKLTANHRHQKLRKSILLQTESSLFGVKNEHGYSVWLLAVNIAAIVFTLYIVNVAHLRFAVLAVTLYFVFVLVRYPNSARHLKKTGFWVQFVIITFLASMLLSGLKQGSFFGYDGLKTGLYMNLRAAIILAGFSAISTELKNPVIKAVTMRRGLAELYQSVNLAFSALPAIFAMLPATRDFFRKPSQTFADLYYHSEGLLETFEKQLVNRPDVVIITGDRQQGKTTFVKQLITELKMQGVEVAGFLAPGVHEAGDRVGFDLMNIRNGEMTQLCRNSGVEGVKFSRFIFSIEGIAKGDEILLPENIVDSQLVVIDEIGPMELKRQGWWKAVTRLVEASKVPQLWVVRRNIVRAVAANWGVGDVYILDIQKDTVSDAVDQVTKLITL